VGVGGLPRPQARAGGRLTPVAVARLTKRAVERLLAEYDTDPIGALTTALRVVLVSDASWPGLVELATDDAGRRARLLAGDVDALDELARELNELRGLGR
jgi:hypothetical protein